MSGAYDPRAIANLMLDVAEEREIKITNLALQKLLYFAHGIFLSQNREPLVSGYFEAWQYGPVHPSVYRAFKRAGADSIKMRAVAEDPLTGKSRDLPKPTDREVIDLVTDVVLRYGKISPGRLVDLSHAKGSPWDVVADSARTKVVFGMRIPNAVILERFQHHKVSVDAVPRAGEPPSDDTPFA
ncbi:Antitoxin SocA [uncultured Defluviicoccus sp.]|uniref:Antitoxin SocA n=1 Tax=metagenome TaxID=256318 RepID=A0A380TCZ9_9ZZZZ|nr:Antitoxin SocA [uncultured Defluviicoccus sp.]